MNAVRYEVTNRRPFDSLDKNSPFFLTIDHRKWELGQVWYKSQPAGVNAIGDIMTLARKRFNLSGNVSNHTVRKTCIGRLLDSDIPDTYVAQHVGMKNTNSLKSYKTPGKKHKMKMSDILACQSGDADDTIPKSTPEASSSLSKQFAPSSTITRPEPILGPSQFPNQPLPAYCQSASLASMVSSAGTFTNLSGCTFNFNFGSVGGMLPENEQPKKNFSFGNVGALLQENDRNQKRRRVHFISSDESSQE